jgi:hypothetical protein
VVRRRGLHAPRGQLPALQEDPAEADRSASKNLDGAHAECIGWLWQDEVRSSPSRPSFFVRNRPPTLVFSDWAQAKCAASSASNARKPGYLSGRASLMSRLSSSLSCYSSWACKGSRWDPFACHSTMSSGRFNWPAGCHPTAHDRIGSLGVHAVVDGPASRHHRGVRRRILTLPPDCIEFPGDTFDELDDQRAKPWFEVVEQRLQVKQPARLSPRLSISTSSWPQ